MLGDGRALLLGELISNDQRYDIQLKGSGTTKYSRRGDGKSTLSSMLREYLMSEAMYYLGIKTTRSLAVVKTGDPVYREKAHQGAILTRIAQSHIRVGTFEYARYYTNELEKFTKYVIKRHDPELLNTENYALEFLKSVVSRQIDLVVDWMRVGFIHGVMNTDNMSIAGETIDYGPCAFMNVYHPKTVFSSIDHHGRYAFGNQPFITHWNLAILANALLPLISDNEKIAIDLVEQVLDRFPNQYQSKFYEMMLNKLGIKEKQESDRKLVDDILELLENHRVDYTNFFISLKQEKFDEKLNNDVAFNEWRKAWMIASMRESSMEERNQLMDQFNPYFIPRNHLVEQALDEGIKGNISVFNNLLNKIKRPYLQQEAQTIPVDFDLEYQTFCGT